MLILTFHFLETKATFLFVSEQLKPLVSELSTKQFYQELFLYYLFFNFNFILHFLHITGSSQHTYSLCLDLSKLNSISCTVKLTFRVLHRSAGKILLWWKNSTLKAISAFKAVTELCIRKGDKNYRTGIYFGTNQINIICFAQLLKLKYL